MLFSHPVAGWGNFCLFRGGLIHQGGGHEQASKGSEVAECDHCPHLYVVRLGCGCEDEDDCKQDCEDGCVDVEWGVLFHDVFFLRGSKNNFTTVLDICQTGLASLDLPTCSFEW